MAAVPSIGRATRVERPVAPGADAATVLYERYSGQILSYCLHQLGSREEAEDAVQTTFMNAFRGLSRGIVPELESAWLFKIAHNVCLSRRRSSWRRGKVEAPNNFEVLQEVIPGREQVSDELIRLQDVLEEMPENQRRAILLREWQGLTYREIATELGLSQAAVETLIFRARRALAAGLEQQDTDTWKSRLRRGSDFGGIAGVLQALLSGGGAAAVKVAATAVAVATTAVAAAPTHTHAAPAHRPPAAKHAKAPLGSHRFAPLGASRDSIAQPHATKLSSAPIRSGNRHVPKPPVARPNSDPTAPTSAPTASPAVPESAPAAPVAGPTPPSVPSAGGHKPKDDRRPQAVVPPPAPPGAQPPLATRPSPVQDNGKGKRANDGTPPDASPPAPAPAEPPASAVPPAAPNASDRQGLSVDNPGRDKPAKHDRRGAANEK